MFIAPQLHIVHACNGVWILPKVEMESPLLWRRQRAVKHLDGILILCLLAVAKKLHCTLVCTGFYILRHLNCQPKTTACCSIEHCGIGGGYAVGDRHFAICIDIVTTAACKTVCEDRLHKTTDDIRSRDNTPAALEVAEPVLYD